MMDTVAIVVKCLLATEKVFLHFATVEAFRLRKVPFVLASFVVQVILEINVRLRHALVKQRTTIATATRSRMLMVPLVGVQNVPVTLWAQIATRKLLGANV
jgi:hypothetical protein